jgi:hypothetical protein
MIHAPYRFPHHHGRGPLLSCSHQRSRHGLQVSTSRGFMFLIIETVADSERRAGSGTHFPIQGWAMSSSALQWGCNCPLTHTQVHSARTCELSDKAKAATMIILVIMSGTQSPALNRFSSRLILPESPSKPTWDRRNYPAFAARIGPTALSCAGIILGRCSQHPPP